VGPRAVRTGIPPASFGRKVVAEYPRLQLNGWKVWPLVSLINYRYVPVQFRVLFANVVALFW
jgi:peroxisomal membrane protein 2